MQHSRTYNSIKNSVVAMSLYFITLVFNFFSRQVFINYLGAEVLGLNTTATSLLQFLNLAELGISSAVAFTLYKPLHDNDLTCVNEIVSLQGWLYRKVATLVIVSSIVLMCFFPWIFGKMELPLWYAYGSFSVLLFSALLGYFVNYKQIVLSANQQEYKINYCFRINSYVKVIFQILAIMYLDHGYVWWLALEVFFAITTAITLNWEIKKSFPSLKTNVRNGKILKNKYPVVVTKIKQLFFHKIGTFVFNQTSPIILYAYTTLTMVAIYGNYMLIVTGVNSLLAAMFNGMMASVGNLVAEGDTKRTLSVFGELFTSRFIIITILCYAIYKFSPGFVTLWVGEEYLLDNFSLFLIVLIFYIQSECLTVATFKSAYGLFSDIWSPVAEGTINVGMSVLLGYFWGLDGILIGVLLSLIIIVSMWKPYFLFKRGFSVSIMVYIKMYLKHLLILTIGIFFTELLFNAVAFEKITSYWDLLIQGSFATILLAVILSSMLYIFEDGMRKFTKRVIRILRK